MNTKTEKSVPNHLHCRSGLQIYMPATSILTNYRLPAQLQLGLPSHLPNARTLFITCPGPLFTPSHLSTPPPPRPSTPHPHPPSPANAYSDSAARRPSTPHTPTRCPAPRSPPASGPTIARPTWIEQIFDILYVAWASQVESGSGGYLRRYGYHPAVSPSFISPMVLGRSLGLMDFMCSHRDCYLDMGERERVWGCGPGWFRREGKQD
ncbi:hypothetical protein EW146_g4603 [Bondarzewia mesenterica]|uniref:Uncharacterized protein n=1 Tax=Bondarzewia mesenterica TaxID=1095465 RepID=A0A4S4LUL8_9AGAM|nr:hypothetical protein EW146_g4603 [Bondarzewia mesenterica]